MEWYGWKLNCDGFFERFGSQEQVGDGISLGEEVGLGGGWWWCFVLFLVENICICFRERIRREGKVKDKGQLWGNIYFIIL